MTESICEIAIDQLLSKYQSDFDAHTIGDKCIIVTPFVYPDFASIELFVEPVGDGFLLSDEGETLGMLFVNGLTVEGNPELWKQAQQIAESFGVEIGSSTISTVASLNQLGEASQNLLGAIQAISYFIYKRKNQIRETFDDEVEKLFMQNEVKYDSNYIIRGKASTHKIKFHINSGRNLLIEPVTAANSQSARNKAKAVGYKWLDIRLVAPNLRFVSIIDDRDGKWDSVWSDEEAQSPIFKHSDIVIRWSNEQQELLRLLEDK